jgi:protein TonB
MKHRARRVICFTVLCLATALVAQDSSSESKSDSAPQQAPRRVRVSEKVMRGILIRRVSPKYPDEAREAGIQGVVVLQIVIDTKGHVSTVKVVSGDPLLTPAAVDAAKHWVYQPFFLDGEPIEVETQLQLSFKLSD